MLSDLQNVAALVTLLANRDDAKITFSGSSTFNAAMVLRLWCTPELAQNHAWAVLPMLRINTFAVSEALRGHSAASTVDTGLSTLLKQHVASVSAAFHATLSPDALLRSPILGGCSVGPAEGHFRVGPRESRHTAQYRRGTAVT